MTLQHWFAITHVGLEDIAATEISEKMQQYGSIPAVGSGKKGASGTSPRIDRTEAGLVFFSADEQTAKLLAYTLQSCITVCSFVATTDPAQIVVPPIPLLEGKTFKARCMTPADDSGELQEELGAAVLKNQQIKVNLSAPDVVVLGIIAGKKMHVGIDYLGFDAGKRTYRIFLHKDGHRGPIAYGLLRFAEYSGNLVDCFAGSGAIPIEAAISCSQVPVNFYRKEDMAFAKWQDEEKLLSRCVKKQEIKEKIYAVDTLAQSVKSAEKNAKIAGINKLIEFSRQDLEWLDTRFEKGSIDLIATKPIEPSKLIPDRKAQQVYKEFFYVASFILKPKGKIAVILRKEDSMTAAAQVAGFSIEKRLSVMQGKEEVHFVLFSKIPAPKSAAKSSTKKKSAA